MAKAKLKNIEKVIIDDVVSLPDSITGGQITPTFKVTKIESTPGYIILRGEGEVIKRKKGKQVSCKCK